jgi:23S rRNA (cytidine2498-2'-O)-methyltransferase
MVQSRRDPKWLFWAAPPPRGTVALAPGPRLVNNRPMAFVFATCQKGFEAALKADVARTHPELRLAFSRPGLVTFKAPDQIAGNPATVARPSPWALAWGRSQGRAPDAATAAALLPQDASRLHVFPRDPAAPDALRCTAEMRAALLSTGRFEDEPRAEGCELVADVIVAPGEPALCGVHRHARLRSPWPAGDFPVDTPAQAPSRAYAKLEQAIAWAGLPVTTGQVAVEIGSAPGGAAYALLRRGVTVWSVDPGAMDQAVLDQVGPGGARVHHLCETLGNVRWEALPRAIDWLLCDVHLAPPVALHGLARLVPAWKRSLQGAIVTLKMNDDAMRAEVQSSLARLCAMGFSAAEAAHLPANGQELCAVAWR